MINRILNKILPKPDLEEDWRNERMRRLQSQSAPIGPRHRCGAFVIHKETK